MQHFDQGLHAIELDKTDLILEIPTQFERSLVKENESTLIYCRQCYQRRKSRPGRCIYPEALLQDYNQDVRMQWIQYPAV